MIINKNSLHNIKDYEIIAEIQQHNERITEIFYSDCKRYFIRVYKGIFTKEDIKDDIFQQSFIKLWTEIETKRIFIGNDKNIYRYNRKGETRMLTCRLTSFLIDIAKNDYRDWLRSDRLTLGDDFESFAHMSETTSVIETDCSAENLKERIVADCVSELPPRCKEILTMFYYKGMTLDEIIVARGEKNISKNGLKTGKHKCMVVLKAKVRQMCRVYNVGY